eukprot:CAMPEP_0197586994 /NCGR_PEP_ID=MMETSP1326-20131121/8771_1 /TAXON_ID=1155430 /ORGANISM="Genus nov. species nov., Strain RCC2288" /LENGTH=135 /DNA_ID=CAMNT_0043151679 /DNA_START=175 /DNA_END=582 /DNA_ORIENTATION=+
MSSAEVAEVPLPAHVASVDLFHDVDDPENYLVVHELLGRGHLLNAYEARMTHAQHVEFGVGILNKDRSKARVARPLTQIEIMAGVEREKQKIKAARKDAKELKMEKRVEREEFVRNGGERKLTKKERRKLENAED